MDHCVAESQIEPNTSPRPSVGRLDTLPRCRKELVRLYREARHGELPPQSATRLAHLVGLIAKLLEVAQLDEIAQRVAALEARPPS